MNRFLFSIIMLFVCIGSSKANIIKDVLNWSFLGQYTTSYGNFSNKVGISGATYAGKSAGGNYAIQLNNSADCGIVTTASGGKVKKIRVDWNTGTNGAPTLAFYGKNTPYSNVATSKEEKSICNFTYDGTSIAEFVVNDDCEYIRIQANNALYVNSITIEWENNEGLESISIEGEPTKRTIYEGDTFDAAGLIATGHYTDGSTKNISNEVIWSTTTNLTVGTTSAEVIAQRGDVSSAAYPVSGLSVKSNPEIKSYTLVEDGKPYFLKGVYMTGNTFNVVYYGPTESDKSGTTVTSEAVSDIKNAMPILFSITEKNNDYYNCTLKTPNGNYIYPGTTNGQSKFTSTKTTLKVSNGKTRLSNEGIKIGPRESQYFQVGSTTNKIGGYSGSYDLTLIKAFKEISISEVGYTSFYDSQFAVKLPTGVEGYVAYFDNGAFRFEKVYNEGDILPANTPVILKGLEGNYVLLYDEGGNAPSKNDLKGCSTDMLAAEMAEANPEKNSFYALSLDENGNNVGFYWIEADGAAFNINEGKVYIAINETAIGSKGFSFNDAITKVGKIYVSDTATEKAFDMSGKMVPANSKGIIIINGKKVLNK